MQHPALPAKEPLVPPALASHEMRELAQNLREANIQPELARKLDAAADIFDRLRVAAGVSASRSTQEHRH